MRKKKISAFLKNRRGSIATIGGLTIGVAVAAVGLSVTVAHTYETRADMQRALDAALLSAARSENYQEPQASVQAYMESYIRDAGIHARDMVVTAVYDPTAGVLNGNVRFSVNSIFPVPSMVGESLSPRVAAQVTPQVSRRLEIAMALDMSGSMNEKLAGTNETRMQALQEALSELFDIIQSDRVAGNSEGVFVSVVPYAASVNIGNIYRAVGAGGSIRNNAAPSTNGPEPHAFFGAQKTSAQYMSSYYGVTVNGGGQEVNGTGSTATNIAYMQRGIWAAERRGANLASDLAPEASGAKIPFATAADLRSLAGSNHKSWVTPAMHILPLTNDLAHLRAYAKNLVAFGGTGGHLGMEWAWYTLSPEWRGAWISVPTNSTGVFKRVDSLVPLATVTNLLNSVGDLVGGVLGGLGLGGAGWNTSSYVDPVSLPASYDSRDAKKVLIMMTDGDFSQPVDRTMGTDNTASYQHFERICTAAKGKGVIVYTIAFSDDVTSTAPLRRCASSSHHYVSARDKQELIKAFQRIFTDESQLHVSR